MSNAQRCRRPTNLHHSGSQRPVKIEAGGQDLTGGTLSELGTICDWPCDYDAGWRTCDPSRLVRYTGPLLPGQQHKITWTNSGSHGTSNPAAPFVSFVVSGVSSVDSGLSVDAELPVDVSSDLSGADRSMAADLPVPPVSDNDGSSATGAAADSSSPADTPTLAPKDASLEDSESRPYGHSWCQGSFVRVLM